MLRAASRDLLSSTSPMDVVRAQLSSPARDTEDVDPVLWQLASVLGWPGLALDEVHGGTGQGLIELALVAEEIGRAAARAPLLPTALVGRAVARGGSSELQAELLPALASGSAWASWAFAEPD